MIIHLTSDLMATSGLTAAARRHEIPVRRVSDPNRVADCLQQEPCSLLIIDLQTRGLDLAQLMSALGDSKPSTLAYAQHVREELLGQARACQIENVLTRGQFSREVEGMVAQIAGKTS